MCMDTYSELDDFESLSIKMDEFLIILLEKYLERGVERITTKEHLYSKGMILIENIKLFRRLIKNNFRRYLEEELSEKSVLYDLARDVDGLMLKVKEWELAVRKERLHFCRFQRNVEIRWKAANAMKIKIEENLRKKLAVYTEKYQPRILIGGSENEMRKKSVEMKMKSIEERLKYTNDARCSRQTDLYRTRVKAKKRCLELIEGYDSNIEALYSCKNTLLIDKNSIEKQYFIVQDQLIGQRGLYNRLKEERELNVKQAFLMKLECFRRNRAAKIIQRNWKYCTVRASWKKGKGRK